MKKSLFIVLMIIASISLAACDKEKIDSSSSNSVSESSDSNPIASSSGSEPVSSSSTPVEDVKEFTRLNNYSETKYLSTLESANVTAFKVQDNYEVGDFLVNRLPEPKTSVNSSTELCDVIDYYAFYGIDDFTVQLNYDHGTGLDVINDAYWRCSLLAGSIGIDGYMDGDIFNCKLKLYSFATYTAYATGVPTKVVEIPYQEAKRSKDFNDFKYLDREVSVDVYNTQQLSYAMEKGYKAVPVAGSLAETVMNTAKDVLREIVNDDMNDYEKVSYMHKWLVENVDYDHIGDDFAINSLDKVNEPDMYAALMNSFFLEGPFLSGLGVCHGFAKAMSLMMSIEGIENIRVVGKWVDEAHNFPTHSPIYLDGYSYGYNDHGYVYCNIDGNWYLDDPTYSYGGAISTSNFHRTLGILMRRSDQLEIYGSTGKTLIDKTLDEFETNKYFNYYEYFKYTINDKEYDYSIGSVEEINAFIEHLDTELKGYSSGEYLSMTLYFESASLYDKFLGLLSYDTNVSLEYPFYYPGYTSDYKYSINEGYFMLISKN